MDDRDRWRIKIYMMSVVKIGSLAVGAVRRCSPSAKLTASR